MYSSRGSIKEMHVFSIVYMVNIRPANAFFGWLSKYRFVLSAFNDSYKNIFMDVNWSIQVNDTIITVLLIREEVNNVKADFKSGSRVRSTMDLWYFTSRSIIILVIKIAFNFTNSSYHINALRLLKCVGIFFVKYYLILLWRSVLSIIGTIFTLLSDRIGCSYQIIFILPSQFAAKLQNLVVSKVKDFVYKLPSTL